MARKRKIQIEKFHGIPRGAEHLPSSAFTTVDVETGELKVNRHPRLTADGREIPDPNPVAVPLKTRNIFSADELRRRRQLIEESGGPVEPESLEDANDFDVDDDFGEFTSVWEQSDADLQAINDYRRFKATGEIPEHMWRVIERQKERERDRQSRQTLPPAAKPLSGTPDIPGENPSSELGT